MSGCRVSPGKLRFCRTEKSKRTSFLGLPISRNSSMEKLKARFAVSFRSKVLAPVIGVMVFLLVATVSTVNSRIARQFQTEATRTLSTADAVFRNSQKIRTKNLLLRYRNLPNELRYIAAFQTGDPGTVRAWLAEILGEQPV